MIWPWERWQRAERLAEEAEERLADAHREHADAQRLAEEARRMKNRNGFAEAIRAAFGVPR